MIILSGLLFVIEHRYYQSMDSSHSHVKRMSNHQTLHQDTLHAISDQEKLATQIPINPNKHVSDNSISEKGRFLNYAKKFRTGCKMYENPYPYKILDHADHIVPPPEGNITIVCCSTTKGEVTIAVHPTWAPLGAARFLDMVIEGFFSTKVGLFRSLKNFLVQFGLAGDPAVHKRFHEKGNLKDDISWLPLGPPNRQHRKVIKEVSFNNENVNDIDGFTHIIHADDVPSLKHFDEGIYRNITRYQRGYMAYAGAGKQ